MQSLSLWCVAFTATLIVQTLFGLQIRIQSHCKIADIYTTVIIHQLKATLLSHAELKHP